MALNKYGPDAPSQARQHIEDLKSLCNALLEIRTLKCQRDELLAALKRISAIEDRYNCGDWDEIQEARDIANEAIARMEET